VIAPACPWSAFWIGMGVAGLVISGCCLLLLPETAPSNQRSDWAKSAGRAMLVVFRNPQSILCGVIAGLLFIPTTIFDMVWGVRYLQEAHDVDYASAVMRSATVPLGWIIGCPLLGLDLRSHRPRKPVIIAGGRRAVRVPGVDPLRHSRRAAAVRDGTAAGIASGAAMLPYTVIKEAIRRR
jgi:hypothetical protein